MALTAAAEQQTKTFGFHFPKGSSEIDFGYRDNEATLQQLEQFLTDIAQANGGQLPIKQVIVRGEVSLEGASETNENVAGRRADAASQIFNRYVVMPDNMLTTETNIPWQKLHDYVEASKIPTKRAVMSIIDGDPLYGKVYGSYADDSRIQRLRTVDGALVWDKFDREIFPEMRGAYIDIVYSDGTGADAYDNMQAQNTVDQPTVIILQSKPKTRTAQPNKPAVTPYYGHIKTNLAGWALAIANIAVEFDVARHWSVNLPVYYSDWTYFSSTVRFGKFAFMPEVRYWPSRQNTGLFVGLHGGIVLYDVAVGGKYRFESHDGRTPALGGGMSFGYRMPISSNRRWNLELGLGVGVYNLNTDKYENIADGQFVSNRKSTFVNIDGVSLTFSYAFVINK